MPERTSLSVSGMRSVSVGTVSALRSCSERTSGIGPPEGFGHRIVEVIDEGQDPILEFVGRFEAASLEELSSQCRKPDLDLIHPRGVFRGVDKLDSV